MLSDISHQSEAEKSKPEAVIGGRFPIYGIAGIAIMVLGEALLFLGVDFVSQWFTPIMWTGYILLIDAIVSRLKGKSLISNYPLEFAILLVISIGSWAIFEGYNVVLKNWHYIGLPDNMIVRYAGYAWSFATISTVIFLTYELLDIVLPGENPMSSGRLPSGVFYGFVIFGAASLIVPFIWPSTYMTPLVWMGFAFLLDPINGKLGERSFLTEFFTGRFRSMLIMFLAGLICGLFWEFWNYWATTKWQYDVPYVGDVKIFEMPVLGFLGFLPFAVECFAIYVFVRRLIPIPREVRYLG